MEESSSGLDDGVFLSIKHAGYRPACRPEFAVYLACQNNSMDGPSS